jgi:hypothetical protein
MAKTADQAFQIELHETDKLIAQLQAHRDNLYNVPRSKDRHWGDVGTAHEVNRQLNLLLAQLEGRDA